MKKKKHQPNQMSRTFHNYIQIIHLLILQGILKESNITSFKSISAMENNQHLAKGFPEKVVPPRLSERSCIEYFLACFSQQLAVNWESNSWMYTLFYFLTNILKDGTNKFLHFCSSHPTNTVSVAVAVLFLN